jgi:hypothetical protein
MVSKPTMVFEIIDAMMQYEVILRNNVSQQWYGFTLMQHSAPTLTSDHEDCLVARRNATDSHMDGPIMCSLFTSEPDWIYRAQNREQR